MKLFGKILILALSIYQGSLYAQSWTEMIKNADPDLKKISSEFEASWADKAVEKGKGFKQFKRWEYFVSERTTNQGKLPSGRELWDEIQKKQTQAKGSAVADWQHMGPVAVPNNGGAGRLNCMAFHPSNPSVMWVGAPSGGLWKSTNGGQSWTTNTDWLACIGVSDILIHPVNPEIMYLATGDYDAGDTYSVGILKSTDGGNSWNLTGMSFDMSASRKISRLLMHPTDYDTLIATTSSGIYRSVNGGDSWTLVRGGNFSDAKFKPGDPNTIYAGSSGGLYRSTNAGQSFSLASTLSSASNYNRMQIAVTPADPNYLYALASNASDNGFEGLYLSTDGGTTFTKKSDSPNILGWSNQGTDAGGQGWYDLALTASPVNKNIILTGGVNIWKSVNGGATWSISAHWTGNGAPYVHADIHNLYFSPHNGTTVYACSDGGLFKSTNNGGNWTDLSNGLAIGQLYRLSNSKTNVNMVISGWQDNGTNLRSSSTWAKVRGGDGMECIIDYSNANYMYSSTYYGAISRSNNAGISWSGITDNISETGAWVTPYVMHPTNPQIIYAGYINLYKTTNRGNNWSKITNLSGSSTLRSIAVSESNPNTIYIATTSGILRTTNGGTSWTNLSNNLPLSGTITYLWVSPVNPNIVYFTRGGFSAGNKVYKSTDAGATWTNISGNLPNLPVNCIVYENGSPEGLYVGTDIGVYYKDSLMSGWIPFSDQLPNVIVKELEIHYPSRMIRAATYGRGLWESHLYSFNTSVEEKQPVKPLNISVYPSPATEDVHLRFPTTANKYTSVRIYAADGRHVQTLHFDEDEYQISVSALASGTYVIDAWRDNKRFSGTFIKK